MRSLFRKSMSKGTTSVVPFEPYFMIIEPASAGVAFLAAN